MADLLLDTQALFWVIYSPEHVSAAAWAAINSPTNTIYATLASAQEIAMKIGAGKWPAALDLLENFEERVRHARYGVIAPQAADYANTLHLTKVPGHRDPMDRLIIAMALARRMVLVSADHHAPSYLGTAVIDAGGAPASAEKRQTIDAQNAFRTLDLPERQA
jgi:PIN domain nuclease of toxin-antitoxin system